MFKAVQKSKPSWCFEPLPKKVNWEAASFSQKKSDIYSSNLPSIKLFQDTEQKSFFLQNKSPREVCKICVVEPWKRMYAPEKGQARQQKTSQNTRPGKASTNPARQRLGKGSTLGRNHKPRGLGPEGQTWLKRSPAKG